MIISSGPAQVIASGIVTSFFGHPIRFDEVVDWAVTIRFFEEDGGTPRVDSEFTDDGVEFSLVNFHGQDGRGTAQPALIGETPLGLLFVHFRVFRYGASADYTFQYTFFVSPQDALGAVAVVDAPAKE